MRNQPQIAAIFQARQRQQALLQGGQRLTRVCIIPREYPKSDSDELSF
jgi:hypothetical protein